MQLLRFPVLPGSAEEQVISCGLVKCLFDCLLVTRLPKKYQNSLTCVKVIASQKWYVFYDTQCRSLVQHSTYCAIRPLCTSKPLATYSAV